MKDKLTVSGLIRALRDLGSIQGLCGNEIIINTNGGGRIVDGDGVWVVKWDKEEDLYKALFDWNLMGINFQKELAGKYNTEDEYEGTK